MSLKAGTGPDGTGLTCTPLGSKGRVFADCTPFGNRDNKARKLFNVPFPFVN